MQAICTALVSKMRMNYGRRMIRNNCSFPFALMNLNGCAQKGIGYQFEPNKQKRRAFSRQVPPRFRWMKPLMGKKVRLIRLMKLPMKVSGNSIQVQSLHFSKILNESQTSSFKRWGNKCAYKQQPPFWEKSGF